MVFINQNNCGSYGRNNLKLKLNRIENVLPNKSEAVNHHMAINDKETFIKMLNTEVKYITYTMVYLNCI